MQARLAENHFTSADDVQDFDQLGYRFRPALSTEDHKVFLKDAS